MAAGNSNRHKTILEKHLIYRDGRFFVHVQDHSR